jgi:DNA polymerase IV
MTQRSARTIVHVDMDAFYVSVELLRRPQLRGRPVVVGGTGGRGVVAAASYEARRFGVHSAMSSAQAKRLCPDAVFLPGDHHRYGEVSRVLHEIFAQFTPIVEPIALDEAFLDVTGARRRAGPGVDIAWEIRRRVMERTGLACSLGVAGNKLLAKLASEAAKPVASRAGIEPGAGVVEVLPGEELAFLHPLPVRALWGVGPRTAERLERRAIRTVGDLAAHRRQDLVALLGVAAGRHLWELAQGIDERPVEADRQPKSIGHEETFEQDLTESAEIRAEVVRLADAVAARLRAAGVAARTVTLKIRRSDFSTVTRSVTPPEPLDTGPAVVRALDPLIAELDLSQGVRLVGVSGSNLGAAAVQLRLEVLDTAAESDAARAVDRVRDRFGPNAIGPASGLGRRSTPGERPWGPDPDVT